MDSPLVLPRCLTVLHTSDFAVLVRAFLGSIHHCRHHVNLLPFLTSYFSDPNMAISPCFVSLQQIPRKLLRLLGCITLLDRHSFNQQMNQNLDKIPCGYSECKHRTVCSLSVVLTRGIRSCTPQERLGVWESMMLFSVCWASAYGTLIFTAHRGKEHFLPHVYFIWTVLCVMAPCSASWWTKANVYRCVLLYWWDFGDMDTGNSAFFMLIFSRCNSIASNAVVTGVRWFPTCSHRMMRIAEPLCVLWKSPHSFFLTFWPKW